MWHVWRTGGVYPGFCLEDPMEGDQLEDFILDRVLLKMNRAESGMRRRGVD